MKMSEEYINKIEKYIYSYIHEHTERKERIVGTPLCATFTKTNIYPDIFSPIILP
jgi:hypothetical protein